jgi:hypothetical protein
MGNRRRKGKARQSQIKRARLHLINIFSRNLAIYCPDRPNTFVCPLCKGLAPFAKPEDIDHLISFAHILPEAVGGKQGVLACKDCNSTLGSRIDFHITDEHNFGKWAAGDLPLDGRMIIGDTNLGISATLKDGQRWELRVIPKITHPDQQKRAWKHIASMTGEDEVKVRLPYFNAKGRNAALMHTAFLSLFATFGYEYALSPNADMITHALFHEDITAPVFTKAVLSSSSPEPPPWGLSRCWLSRRSTGACSSQFHLGHRATSGTSSQCRALCPPTLRRFNG